MQFTDSFPKILERMLNLNDTSLKAEVINYGVPAYSTSHEEATVKRAIRDEADLIILQITLNDPELKAIRPSGIGNFSDRFGELKPSGIWESIFKYSKAIEFVAKRLHATKTHSEYVKYFNDLFLNPKTLTPWKRSVNNIVNSTKDAGKKMVAVVFPLFGVPLNDSYPFFEIQHMACDTLSRQEIPCLELFEPFRNIPIDIIQVLPGEDRHPNEIGHRIAAEAIYVWLEKLEIIPNELMIRQKFKQRIGRIPEQQLPMK